VTNKCIDIFNRKISYLRLSVTSECNLNCFYCADGKTSATRFLSFTNIVKILSAASKIGISKIRITGGEPLLRENLTALVSQISKIKNIDDISITTNGHLLPQLAEKLKRAGLHRLNISLDSLNPITYKKINGGNLKNVLNGISIAKKFFDNIRINTVILKNINDNEIDNIISFAKNENLTIRFLEIMPNEFQSTFFVDCRRPGECPGNQHFLSNETVISNLREKYKLTHLANNEKINSTTAEWFLINSGTQKIGFISPVSKPFCEYCNRLRLTAFGELIPCLHGEERISMLDALAENDEEKIIEKFHLAARKKIPAHNLGNGKTFCKMKIIGG